MSPLVASWIFSLVPATLAWWSARSAGVDRLRALCFAAACFPTPIIAAKAGRASFLYACDIAMPIALLLAAQSWFQAPVRFRRALSLIVVGAGVLPLVGTLFTWPDRAPVLQNAVNAIRLVNVGALGIAFSSRPAVRDEPSHRLLLPYAGLAAVIAVAMVLQVVGVLNTNVFHSELVPGDDAMQAAARLDQRLAVLGLFRGSIGIACLMAVGAWLAGPRARGLGWGALAAVLASTLIASKTTLVAMVLLLGVRVLLTGLSSRAAALACLVVVPAMALPFVLDADDWSRINTILELLGTSTENLSTGTGRADIWGNTMADLASDPLRFLGVATHGQLDAAVGVYHNEWLAVLMTGGLLGVVCTIAGVGLMMWLLLRRDAGRTVPLRSVAALVCIGMQLQALSVAHVQPNLFFLPVTAPLLILYALALRPTATPAQAVAT